MAETDYFAGLSGRCPHCGRGSLFAGWIALHPTCPECGARFERWAGSWTGAVVGGYGVGAVITCLAIAILWSLDRLGPNSEFLIAGIAMGSVLLTYRPTKGLWIAAMHDMGYVYPDPDPDDSPRRRGSGRPA